MNIMHIRPFGSGYNIGNYAISLSVRKWLQKIFSDEVNIITVPAISDNLDSGITKKTVYFANQTCDAVIIGGGNLFENNELKVDINALDSLSIPLVLFSNSIGRIYNRHLELSRRSDVMPDSIIKALHEKASFSLPRDLATYNYLKSIIPDSDSIFLGGCPTIFLDKWFHSYINKDKDPDLCLIPIRNIDQMNIPLEISYNIPKIIKNISDMVIKQGFSKVMVICNDQRDIPLANSLGLKYFYTSDVFEYLNLLNSASLVISMRVHATLPALSFGTPVINLSYDERSLSLLKTIGYGEWDINLVKTNNVMDEINDRILSINNLTELKEQNSQKWEDLYEVQEKAILSLK